MKEFLRAAAGAQQAEERAALPVGAARAARRLAARTAADRGRLRVVARDHQPEAHRQENAPHTITVPPPVPRRARRPEVRRSEKTGRTRVTESDPENRKSLLLCSSSWKSVRAAPEVVQPRPAATPDAGARDADVVVPAGQALGGASAPDEGGDRRTTWVAGRRQAPPDRTALGIESDTTALRAVGLRAVARRRAGLAGAGRRRRAGPGAPVGETDAAARSATDPGLRREALARGTDVASAVALLGASATHDGAARGPRAVAVRARQTQLGAGPEQRGRGGWAQWRRRRWTRAWAVAWIETGRRAERGTIRRAGERAVGARARVAGLRRRAVLARRREEKHRPHGQPESHERDFKHAACPRRSPLRDAARGPRLKILRTASRPTAIGAARRSARRMDRSR